MKFLNLTLIFFISIYQKYLSFLFTGSCRFTPSCSEYCKQAFEEFSFIKALSVSILRILRCNPFFEGYEDPINKGK